MRLASPRTIPCLCLAAVLALAGSAVAAEPEAVAPPFSNGGEADAASVDAATESRCRSRNDIAFRQADTTLLRHEVRSFGRIQCSERAPLKRITCFTALYKGEVGSQLDLIARAEGEGTDHCRAGFPFRGRHETGERFVERYGYNLTLRRGFRWTSTPGSYCRLTNDRRTAVCRGQQSTRAPKDTFEENDS